MAKCTCKECRRVIAVSDTLLGRRAKCPGCGQAVLLTHDVGALPRRSASATPAERDTTPDLTQQIAQFREKIAPVRVGVLYLVTLVLVCLVMLALPVIYLGLIASVGYVVYYHLVHHAGMLTVGYGRVRLVMVAAYVAPLVIGCILLLFMAKPLIASPSRQRRIRSLTRDGEPLLFELVDRICESVGSSRPKRIDVNCDVNASASFRNGGWSLFSGGDLVLTIGMPLVAGLTVSEFAGVLAHEFGHFSQGVGMRANYLIRVICNWFVRVVYERDNWDDALAHTMTEVDFRFGWILLLAQGCVWLTRQFLKVLMYIGYGVAGFFSRQMEFDADRYETRLAGSQTFARTVQRLNELGLAFEISKYDVMGGLREGYLPDDLPGLVELHRKGLTPEQRAAIQERISSSTAGWFDLHPSDGARIASAAREAAPGLVHLDMPAQQLLRHFDNICRNVTVDLYRELMGREVTPERLKPLREIVAKQQTTDAEAGLLSSLAGPSYNPLWGIEFPTTFLSAPTNPSEVLAELARARRFLSEESKGFETMGRSYAESHRDLCMAKTVLVAARADLSIKQVVPAADCVDREQANRMITKATQSMEAIREQLQPVRAALGTRIVAAMRLLAVPQVARRIPDAQSRFQCAQDLLSTLQRLEVVRPHVEELSVQYVPLAMLAARLDGAADPLMSELTVQARKVTVPIQAISSGLQRAEFQLDGPSPQSVLSFLMPNGCQLNSVPSIGNACNAIIDGYPTLYQLIAGRLASWTLDVEKQLTVRSKR